MRKTIKTMLAMFLICLSSFAIFGCGAKVEKLEYVEGSMDTTLVLGEELVTTGFKAVATMSDDTTVNLTEKDVKFNTEDLDLTTAGNKELKYSYKDATDTIEIVVTPDASKLSKLEYTGTISRDLSLGDDLDLTKFSAKATYSDGTVVDLTKDDVEIKLTNVDLTTTGEKYIPFTFQGKTNYITINVIETTEVSAFISNINNDFTSNKDDFKVKSDVYVVGDMNEYDPRISAKGYIFDDENGDVTEQPINNVATEVKVEKLTSADPDTYTELTATEYDLYFDEISDVNGILNFSPDAINNIFKVTISSKYFSDTTYEQAPTITQYIKVVSGYNIYDAKGLSLLDNSSIENNEYFGWNELKTQEELSLSNNINALVLHNDIHITDLDIPSTLFWSEEEVKGLKDAEKSQTNLEIVGSMEDHPEMAVYDRKTTGEFKIYGNYFTIDSSAISRTVLEMGYDKQDGKHGIKHDKNVSLEDQDGKPQNEQAITIHSNLIKIEPMSYSTAINPNTNDFYDIDINDVYFLGNGPRSNRSIYSGGHILLKSEGINLNVNNTIHKDFFIGFFNNMYDDVATSEADLSSYKFENCIGSNSYNTLFYIWGAKDVKIIDSSFTSAGGPAMVIDHVQDENDPTYSFPSNVELINSTIESYITGEEPWFATYEGTTALAQELKKANEPLFKPFGRTFVVEHEDVPEAMNLVAVVKSSTTQGITTVPVTSSVSCKVLYDHDGDTNTPDVYYNNPLDLKGTTEDSLSAKAMSYEAVYFQSQLTGKYINTGFGSTNIDANALTMVEGNPMPDGSHASGDYVNVYIFNGMGAVLGVYPLEA